MQLGKQPAHGAGILRVAHYPAVQEWQSAEVLAMLSEVEVHGRRKGRLCRR